MSLKFDKILGKLREEDGGGTFSGTLDDITAGSTNVHLTTTLKSTYDGLVSNSHASGSDNQDLSNLVEKVTGKGLSTNDYDDTAETKLAGIETGANNYSHPSSHAPSIITQDVDNRFVSDTEKSTWNAKSNLVLGDLSTNAYYGDKGKTAYDHSQVAHAPSGAEVNVNADWSSGAGDSQILNKPTLGTAAAAATTDFAPALGIDDNYVTDAEKSALHTAGADTSLGNGAVAQDHGTAVTDQIVNVCYGTGLPPTASDTTEGTLFIQYTA